MPVFTILLILVHILQDHLPRLRGGNNPPGWRGRMPRSIPTKTLHMALTFSLGSIIGLLQAKGDSLFLNYPINLVAALVNIIIYSTALAAETELLRCRRRNLSAIASHICLLSGELSLVALATIFFPNPSTSVWTMVVLWAFVLTINSWHLIRLANWMIFWQTPNAIIQVVPMFARHMRFTRQHMGDDQIIQH